LAPSVNELSLGIGAVAANPAPATHEVAAALCIKARRESMDILCCGRSAKDTAFSDIAFLGDPTVLKRALGNMGRPTCRPFAGDECRRQHMGINKDQVEGRAKEAAGKIQEVAGKAVGSTTQQVKGAVNKAAGAAQAKYGDVKNDLNNMNKDSKKDQDR
jgi:uncharacterized protein YjbJ (UPF0337 family)